jgi:hypothetical protein
MQILFDLLISPDLLQSGKSTSWAFCLGHREVEIIIRRYRHFYQVDGGHASSEHHTRRRISYTVSAYPYGSSQIIGFSSNEQNLQDVVQTLVSTIKHHRQHILK